MVLWALLTSFLFYEYNVLDKNPEKSVLSIATAKILKSKIVLSTALGRPLSWYVGWSGLWLMIIMCSYIIRKRVDALRNFGDLKKWLDFHIFCGVMGPTLICFHCNFKIHGLVGISFWSMMIAAGSGFVGRYFYGQVILGREFLIAESERILKRIKEKTERRRIQLEQKEWQLGESRILAFVGYTEQSSLLFTFINSVFGDLKLVLLSPPRMDKLPAHYSRLWVQFGVLRRKAQLITHFQKLLGYWHVFHTPFAVFMYIAAVIHVIASYILASPFK